MILHGCLTCRRLCILVVLAALVVAGGFLIFAINKTGATLSEEEFVLTAPDPVERLPPSPSKLGRYKQAAVVSNGISCASIGKQMLERGGSAVDAAIATLLCDGVSVPHNMGLGGGFLMTVYDRSTRSAVTLNARETAPAAATRDMYHGNSTLSTIGGLSVAVPGELRGYQAAWERFGKLPWRELFLPTIRLCEEGVPINQNFARNLRVKEAEIRKSETLRKTVLNEEGAIPKEGELIKFPRLARTLRIVAESHKMADELYNGSLTQDFVADIREAAGIITIQDMVNYKAKWSDPVTAKLSQNMTLYSMPPPGSGLLLSFVLRLLDDFVTAAPGRVQMVQRTTEAFKHAFAYRTRLGDPDFVHIEQLEEDLSSAELIRTTRRKISDNKTVQDARWYGADYTMPDDHGTANVVVLAPNGDAVAVTSTVNLLFGSQLVSMSTGIILNDQMDDFSAPDFINYFGLPPSPANYIEPGKRPMSSMCPSIIVDGGGDVRLVVGAAGGTKITTSTAMVSVLNLWFDNDIKEAIDYPRFHHQLFPMKFAYEYGLTKDIVDGMKRIGHEIERMPISWRACVTAIARNGSEVTANSDDRRPGSTAGF